jgi:16S rRNA (guanine527-N7)-methyltransferase
MPEKNFDSYISFFSNELLKWNKVHNLIGKNTENEIVNRHIQDSLQLKKFITEDIINITDFGSGAGLPAMILAISYHFSDTKKSLNLYEANSKKSAFLNHIVANLELKNCTINQERIEEVLNPLKADLITARAFASLNEIFKISKKFLHQKTKFVLHKGINISDEILKAQENFSFEYKLNPSDSGDGFIITVENLSTVSKTS